jgi:hypothetical protein
MLSRKRTGIGAAAFLVACLVLGCGALEAGVVTPSQIGAPFGVQPFAGLGVSGGVTDPFFSDLSGLAFPGPGIVGILAGLQAFGSGGDSISAFNVTGVTVTQGNSTFTPTLQMFSLSSPVTYTSTLNPGNSVTVNPGDLNLAFIFNSDASFQYSYTLNTTGIPDGGFLLYNDVEGALVPEPGTWLLMASGLGMALWRRRNSRIGSTG